MLSDAVARAQALHSLDGQLQRRAVPESSGAIACWGAEWARIIELLANPISDAMPEIKNKQTIWIAHCTGVGGGPAYFDARRGPMRAGQRPVDETPGVSACWSATWAEVIDMLADSIVTACPEVNHRPTHMILRARPNGLRIEFFADEASFTCRSADSFADLMGGPQVHCGGNNGLTIAFFDDDDAFRKLLARLARNLTQAVQIHAGRLTWL